ncbi:MAG TPA: porin family protein [Longimicrobiales bacterium]|nr:porin family protein [Longimicrobiales bacterium]
MRRLTNVAAAAALVFALTGAAEAQMTIGAKGGLNLSNIENAEVLDSNSRSAFVGGGFLRMGFLRGLTLQPELLYSSKGSDFPDEGVPGGQGVEWKLDYVEIPVLARYDFPFEPFRPYLMAGPYGAFEVKCEIGDDDAVQDCDDTNFFGAERRKFDWGAIVGGGLSFGMGPGRLLLETRYGIGVQDIFDDPEGVDNEDIEHRWASFLVGFEVVMGR